MKIQKLSVREEYDDALPGTINLRMWMELMTPRMTTLVRGGVRGMHWVDVACRGLGG